MNKYSDNKEESNYLHYHLLKEFINNRKLGPNEVCICCNCLFYESSTKNFNEINLRTKFRNIKLNGKLKNKELDEETFIYNIKNSNSTVICTTCLKHANEGKIPIMAATENLRFAKIPKEISCLSDIEERMVSPYIVFMQIRPLTPYALNPQLSLRGSVVNIDDDINEMIETLPRNFDQLSTLQIQLKRHVEHRSSYMTETIQPWKIFEALNHLINTPLYIKHQIKINEDSMNYYNSLETKIDFIVDKKYEKLLKNSIEMNELITHKTNEIHDEIESDIENNVIEEDLEIHDDEVLILDRNKEITEESIKILAPAQNKNPLPWHTIDDIDELAFPRIFGGYKFDENKILTTAKRYKFLSKNKDRRACKTTMILYMAKKTIELSVASSINTFLRKTKKTEKLTREDALNPEKIYDLVRLNEGYKFLENVRGSPPYWEKRKKEAFAMIRQLGPPHMFLTLSFSETKNCDLLKILYKLKYDKNISLSDAMNLEMDEKTKLIRDDPVTCVRYTVNRFNNIIKILMDPNGPFGQFHVTDFFRRDEFQARGSSHIHCELYCENAPIYNENDSLSIKNCIEFIDKFITCEYDSKNPLMTYQRHAHKPTCYKGRKNEKICRFNIPNYVMKETMILEPLNNDKNCELNKNNLEKIKQKMQDFFNNTTDITFEEMLNDLQINEINYIEAIRSSLDQPKVFLKRKSNEVAINAYNKTILALLESNMDIQFILNPYSCISYMINYITKIDAGLSKLLRQSVENVLNGNMELKSRLRKVGNTFVNANVLSAQEAVYHILSFPLTQSSRKCVYINTIPINERVGMMKCKKELEILKENSYDIYQDNIFSSLRTQSGNFASAALN